MISTTTPKPGVDLEKELTCSICADILFEPLTLLDCLHTFCGACLKDWFSWQKQLTENSPDGPAVGAQTATCPSCRATVVKTRHNATVATLLDMFLLANPDKARSDADKEEMRLKYKPGDHVVPPLIQAERSSEERKRDHLEQQMVERAREMSLREASLDSSESPSRRARRRQPVHHDHDRSDADRSRETRHRAPRDDSGPSVRRPDRGQGDESWNLQNTDSSSSDETRQRSRPSHEPSPASARSRSRAIGHQGSIRTLLSSSDVGLRDMEREIEDFARQIQEEGLLDGLDLDNIDLTRNDELSQRITDAYRRRQSQRSRREPVRRSDTSVRSHQSESVSSTSRRAVSDTSRPSSRRRASPSHPRPSTSSSQADDRSRPPVTSTHLEIRSQTEQRRRRTSTGSRSVTDPVPSSLADSRPATRSQTDLAVPSSHVDTSVVRPTLSESRRPGMAGPPSPGLPFSQRLVASRSTTASPTTMSPSDPAPDSSSRGTDSRRRPGDAVVSSMGALPSLGLVLASGPKRPPPQFYPEPSITCSGCQRPHIEYELHHNCATCAGGNWNICSRCYRAGKGCLHWFGFGYAAFNKWMARRVTSKKDLEPPHMLTSNRFLPPRQQPGGAEGRRTLTTDDPMGRLESGMFCGNCAALANGCFWRCDVCNEADWGFCHACINQGHGCTHPLLPLTYVPPQSGDHGLMATSPSFPRLPPSASLLAAPSALRIGNFQPLVFRTTCSVCHSAIPPSDSRYHCYSCSGIVQPNPDHGDYELCSSCYLTLVRDRRISAENGPAGWRRCLDGHRMAVVAFQEAKGGLWRHVIREPVGGRSLRSEPYAPSADSKGSAQTVQKWSWWLDPSSKLERLVSRDPSGRAPTGPPWADTFPPDGGVGMKAVARWAWLPRPGADDELLFPKGAEIREVEDVNGEWFYGCYMGHWGLFPAPYVRVVAD